jgi:hypothetical protein
MTAHGAAVGTCTVGQQHGAAVGCKAGAPRNFRERRDQGRGKTVWKQYRKVKPARSDFANQAANRPEPRGSPRHRVRDYLIDPSDPVKKARQVGLHNNREMRIGEPAADCAQSRQTDDKVTQPVDLLDHNPAHSGLESPGYVHCLR